MGMCVCGGATLQCSFGVAPGTLLVLPLNKVISKMPVATIMDNKPLVNIMPFGMCNSMANPQVIAATAAAMGVMTPMPCVPVTTAPWTPGSMKTLIGGNPALTDSSKLMCMWGGNIQIVNPGVTDIQLT